MFGCYIKGRGWIKKIDSWNKVKCCRSPSDIHDDFLFVNKHSLNKRIREYSYLFENLEYEYRKIPEDSRLDKRVIPHKKNRFGYTSYIERAFELDNQHIGWHRYCSMCDLEIKEDEPSTDAGICIHCLKMLHDEIKVHYDKMDDEIKRAWERARIIDEI